MNSRLSAFLGLCMLFITLQAKSQTETDLVVEQIIESMSENAAEDFDYSELTERLQHYQKNPINLNQAEAEQLQDLLFLSPAQVNAILSYRDQHGRFIELFELQAVDLLDATTIKKMLPFCSLSEPNPFSKLRFHDLLTKGNNDVMFTFGQLLQKPKGYFKPEDPEKSHYAGSRQRFLTRYRYHYGQALSASLTMEKDAGEPLNFQGGGPGFDFYSGNISYKGSGLLRKIVLGDYSLQFGQGLSLWSGLSFGKGAAVASITKNNIGLKPYTSTNEALFLRGISGTLHLKHFDFTPFMSYRNIDGTVSADNENPEVSALGLSGFHRTQNEITNKNNVSQLVYGANLQFSGRALRVGTNIYQTSLSHPFEESSAVYKKYSFNGDKLSNVGVYYNYNWRNMYFFGEAAHSGGGGMAFLNGAIASLSRSVSVIMFQRDYQRNYHSFFNQAVAEGTNAANEKGFYSGLVITRGKKAELNVYADFFRFPWLRFRVDAPSSGHEFLSQFSYSPTKRLKAIVRYRFEKKQENDSEENAMNFLADVLKQNYRFELSYKIADALQLRNRVEFVDYQKEAVSEKGYLLFQDISYAPLSSRISGNFRYAIFNTPGFNSRLYAYENDVLYSYSVPAYQNSGLRFYVNGRWRLSKSADVWFKYAVTRYTNLESIGSGLDTIEGNKKSDFKIQARFQF